MTDPSKPPKRPSEASRAVQRAAFPRALLSRSDLRDAVMNLCRAYKVDGDGVWGDVKKGTPAGRLVVELLDGSDLLVPHRPPDFVRAWKIADAIRRHERATATPAGPARKTESWWKQVGKALAAQDPPILGNGSPPRPMSPSSLRKARLRGEANEGNRYFGRIEADDET